MTYLNLYLIDEDPVENMLQIVTVRAGFNNDYCYTDFHTNKLYG